MINFTEILLQSAITNPIVEVYIDDQQNAGSVWHFRSGDRIIRQPIHQFVLADSYLALIEYARQGLGIVRVSSVGVREDLATGALVQILPEFENVYADGELAAIWILYPNRSLLRRTRLFVTEFSDYPRTTMFGDGDLPKLRSRVM